MFYGVFSSAEARDLKLVQPISDDTCVVALMVQQYSANAWQNLPGQVVFATDDAPEIMPVFALDAGDLSQRAVPASLGNSALSIQLDQGTI